MPTTTCDAPLTLEETGSGRLVQIRAGQVLGLLFLTGPVSDLARAGLGAPRTAAVAVLYGAFVALYLALLPPARPLARRGPRAVAAAVGLLTLLEVAVLALGAPGSSAALSFYVIAAAGFALPPRQGLLAAGGMAAALAVGMRATGSSASAIAAVVLTALSLGCLMVAFAHKLRINRELRRAREELARLAVADERLRIARDLHDLLGHSLSVIALKSELAERLLTADPEQARAELTDVQRVTRQALAEVREAVQGYRRMALADAVGSARAALAAAGIDVRVQQPPVELPSEVEDVLAWALREAATNVVRHSGARACAITLRAEPDRVALEVADDGTAAASRSAVGSGLAGLAERAEQLHGTLHAGPGSDGGFRLRLSLPLAPT